MKRLVALALACSGCASGVSVEATIDPQCVVSKATQIKIVVAVKPSGQKQTVIRSAPEFFNSGRLVVALPPNGTTEVRFDASLSFDGEASFVGSGGATVAIPGPGRYTTSFALYGCGGGDGPLGDLGLGDRATADLAPPSLVVGNANTLNDLYAVWGSAANDVWAVGNNGEARHSSDGGATWSPVTGGGNLVLYTVWGRSSADVFTVGGSSVGHITGPSNTWMFSPSFSNNFIKGLTGNGATLWATGGVGAIYRSTDGTAWISQPSNESGEIDQVLALSGQVVVAVGSNAGAGGFIVRTTDGMTWSEVKATPHPLFALGGDATTLVAGGGDGDLFRSGDQGVTWKQTNGGTGSVTHGLWLGGNQAWSVGDGGAILYSNDAGLTWAKASAPVNIDYYGVWSDGTAVVVVGKGGTVLHSP